MVGSAHAFSIQRSKNLISPTQPVSSIAWVTQRSLCSHCQSRYPMTFYGTFTATFAMAMFRNQRHGSRIYSGTIRLCSFLFQKTSTPSILVGVGGFTAVIIFPAFSSFGRTVRGSFRGSRASIQHSQAISPIWQMAVGLASRSDIRNSPNSGIQVTAARSKNSSRCHSPVSGTSFRRRTASAMSAKRG